MAIACTDNNSYLSSGFRPIQMELDRTDLAVTGDLPQTLNGTYYRIGPNPQFPPRGPYNPLMGDGMIHAFHFRDGKISYLNRWVRTEQWKLERAAGKALFGTTGNPKDNDSEVKGLRTDGVANTNVIWHGNRLLALEEFHSPIEIDPISLETNGPWDFAGALPNNMSAHPKIDPVSGDMVFFANEPEQKYTGELALYIVNARGDLICSQSIPLPFSALVHDFAITRDFIIFPICPVTISIERAIAGNSPLAWEPKARTHIGVVPRTGRSKDVRWFTGAPCMAWHVMNSFNIGNRITLDVCSQQSPAIPQIDGKVAPQNEVCQYLTRWNMDLETDTFFHAQPLSNVVCEYPRIDERRTGQPYRYGYVACLGGPGTDDIFHRGIGHFDHLLNRMSIYTAPPHCSVGEPVFVPKYPSSAEGEGYLLSIIYDERKNTSYLAVLNAEEITKGPIACAHVDHRIPQGFHGLWKNHETDF